MMNIGKLEIVEVRKAFPHEAYDFTKWLEENIDALSKRLGMTLKEVTREVSFLSGRVDLLCKDGNNQNVIIENQLEASDYDHLGKLLSYSVHFEAKTAIWITPEPRPVHQRVIQWLNEVGGEEIAFFLVKIEAVRIGDSPFAPLFTILAEPSEEATDIGETKEKLGLAERHYKRKKFWTGFLEKSKQKTRLLANRTPPYDHWLDVSIGRGGIGYNLFILKDKAGIDLTIDVGDYEKNKQLFDILFEQKESIETEFGETLEWRRMDDKRTSRVVRVIEGEGGLNEPESWPVLQDRLIDLMLRFDKLFRPHIDKLPR